MYLGLEIIRMRQATFAFCPGHLIGIGQHGQVSTWCVSILSNLRKPLLLIIGNHIHVFRLDELSSWQVVRPSVGRFVLPGIAGPPNFAVGLVTLTAILYPQLAVDICYSRRKPKNSDTTKLNRIFQGPNNTFSAGVNLWFSLNYYI